MLPVAEQAHRTDTGRQRQANEDALFARAPVFAVADGMGGAQAGEVASQIATEALEETDPGERGAGALPARRPRGRERAHPRASPRRMPRRSGMGTTLTAVLIRDDEISIAHVGDSRAYLYRDGELKRLTSDHSLVEELRRQGRLTDEQAEEHPQRSIITRALGPEPAVEVDTMTYQARAGDVILLCSDGLTTMVPSRGSRRSSRRAPTLDAAVAAMIDEANARGGRDNITVVAFRLEEEGVEVADSQATLIGPTRRGGGPDRRPRRRGRRRRRGEPRRTPPRRRPRAGAGLGRMARDAPRAADPRRRSAPRPGTAAARSTSSGVDEAGRVTLYRGASLRPPVRRSSSTRRSCRRPVQLTVAAARPPRRGDQPRAALGGRRQER